MPSKQIPIRFSEADLELVDRARGSVPRGTWLKTLGRLAALEVQRHGGRACRLRVVAEPVGEPLPIPGQLEVLVP